MGNMKSYEKIFNEEGIGRNYYHFVLVCFL